MMTGLAPFHYECPANLPEALSLVEALTGDDEAFCFCSGGTDLIPELKYLENSPCTLVSLTALEELKGVTEAKGTLRIGSQSTLAELGVNSAISKYFPCLSKTLSQIASPQIRYRATIGGNLLVNNRCVYFNQTHHNRQTHTPCFKADGDTCHLVKNVQRGDSPLCRARFVSDLAPILLLLNAKVALASVKGNRLVPLREFYLSDGIDSNQKKIDEILTHIEINLPGPQTLTYEKLRIRNAIDFPSLGVAVSTQGGNEGMKLSVALTGMETRPLWLELWEKDFSSQEQMIEHACTQAKKSVVVLKQDFFPPEYRRKMIGVLIRRGLGCPEARQ